MASNRSNLLVFLALVLSSFFFLNSATNAQEQKGPVKEGGDTFKAVNEFCDQRNTMDDRAFCKTVLKLNPKSATAKDNPTLLKIAIELAIGNAERTKDFFKNLSQDNVTPPAVKAVLQPCILAYFNSIKELQHIGEDLEDDPPMASYDAYMAAEHLNACSENLVTSKITEQSILSRNKIGVKYSILVEELCSVVT